MNNNHQTGLEAYREAVKSGLIEVVQLSPVEKLAKNPKSLRLAINAMCYQCMGGYKNEIRGCTAKDCALYNVRPYRGKDVEEEE